MSTFPYLCPSTGASVTGWQADDLARQPAERQRLYVAERCPACSALHIVNPETGRLLADESATSLRPIKGATTPISAHV